VVFIENGEKEVISMSTMKVIDQIYINGQFVKPHGQQRFELINPSTGQKRGWVVLGDETDARDAIAAAKAAFPSFSQTSVAERAQLLTQLHEALAVRRQDLIEAMLEEYGASRAFVEMAVEMAIQNPLEVRRILENYSFIREVNRSKVAMEPVGVAALITPWNSNAGFITSKFSMALAAGCTTVIKPSEMSATQTQIVLEAVHKAGLPRGLFNLVNGLGEVVGAEYTRSKDVAKISFTGSTVVGKTIARDASATLKRVTLELGGKSPNIPQAVGVAFMNNGQACIAGTRLLVPKNRLEQVKALLVKTVSQVKVGNPAQDPSVTIGPMVNARQHERVQNYIRKGLEEGAELLIGGPGLPEGLSQGYFTRPTVFVNVRNDMTIAREEIFGPVLSVLTYDTVDQALDIANDTDYGLQSYITTRDSAQAMKLARRLQTGRVLINSPAHDPQVPFGGFKQSGLGREFGVPGLESYLEPKSILGS
jgi:aldehyde dehydrogenase (NAD+)